MKEKCDFWGVLVFKIHFFLDHLQKYGIVLFYRQINFTNNHKKFSTVYKDKCKVVHVWTNKAGIKILIKVCCTQDTSVATMRSSSSHQWLSSHAPLTIHESYSPSHTLVLLRLQHAQIYLGIFFFAIPPKYYCFISGAYFHGVKIALSEYKS